MVEDPPLAPVVEEPEAPPPAEPTPKAKSKSRQSPLSPARIQRLHEKEELQVLGSCHLITRLLQCVRVPIMIPLLLIFWLASLVWFHLPIIRHFLSFSAPRIYRAGRQEKISSVSNCIFIWFQYLN